MSLLLHPIRTSRDRDRAMRSRLLWGRRPGGLYVLTPLGLLNTALIALHLPPVKVRDPFPPFEETQ